MLVRLMIYNVQMAEEAAIETAETIEAQCKTAAITTTHTKHMKQNSELGPYMAG